MKLVVTHPNAGYVAHKMHFLFHSMYLTVATLEGHLLHSVMAGGTLLFMLGAAALDAE